MPHRWLSLVETYSKSCFYFSLYLASCRWPDGDHQVHAPKQQIQGGDCYMCLLININKIRSRISVCKFLFFSFLFFFQYILSRTHRWCCILKLVNLALWWSLCQLTLMVSFSLTSHMLRCVNNITYNRLCSLCVSQFMLPPLPTLMSPHMPVIMTRPETPTWETGTVSTGWKTPTWFVHV